LAIAGLVEKMAVKWWYVSFFLDMYRSASATCSQFLYALFDYYVVSRVSTTPGNLLEFKNPPGNLLEFSGPPGNFYVR